MKIIPFADPHGLFQNHKREILQTVKKVLDGGIYILGKEVFSFEEEFAAYLGVKGCIGVASGTDALTLAIKACGVSEGDNVLVPTNAYPTVFALSAIGVVPRLVDCDPKTYTIDPTKVEKAITKKTKAIIVVHLYGQAADMKPILAIAKKHKLFIIEDCAQAHGALYKKKYVGTFGDIACFSFYPTKNLGCYGDGGAVVSNNIKLLETVKLLHMYGEKERYNSVLLGTNSRLDELQAAILRKKLPYLSEENNQRKKIAGIYKKGLQEIKQIILPEEREKASHIFHLFVIQAEKRDMLKEFLFKNGVLSAIHYPVPIHLQKSFSSLGYTKKDFPVATRSASSLLSLPIFPTMKISQVNRVISLIKKFYS
jgi:dTDP-4-amino-4,6-dideoxygalactose transaminase